MRKKKTRRIEKIYCKKGSISLHEKKNGKIMKVVGTATYLVLVNEEVKYKHADVLKTFEKPIII